MTSRGICQGVGVSSRKGELFPLWTKMVHTKIKPGILGTLIFFKMIGILLLLLIFVSILGGSPFYKKKQEQHFFFLMVLGLRLYSQLSIIQEV